MPLPDRAQPLGPDTDQDLAVGGRHVVELDVADRRRGRRATIPVSRFIGGEPMNPATNTFAGWS